MNDSTGTKQECEEKQDDIDHEENDIDHEEDDVDHEEDDIDHEEEEKEQVMKSANKENQSVYINTRVRVPKKRKPVNEQVNHW